MADPEILNSVGAIRKDTPTDSGSETDLTGLDALQPPSSMTAPLDQNIQSAEAERAQAGAYGDAQIEEARGDMRGSMRSAISARQQYQNQGPSPNDHIDALMSASPWLIALSVFGGARSKLSANNLMAAQIGMIDGINKGNEQGYQQAYKKWKDEHEKLADLMDQKWAVYREMAKAYKGTVDAKQKALAVAEQAVRDARSDKAHTISAWQQSVRAAIALKSVGVRIDANTESARHHRETEAAAREKEKGIAERAAGKGGAKTGVAEIDNANALIDKIIGLVQKPHTLSRVGTGGIVSRGIETVGNVTGMTDDTSAHDLESAVDELKTKVAPMLIKGSRTAKDQREKLDKIVRGLNIGDTDQNTISALTSLRDEFTKLAPPKKIVAVSKDGKKVKYSDGSTGPNTTGAKPASIH